MSFNKIAMLILTLAVTNKLSSLTLEHAKEQIEANNIITTQENITEMKNLLEQFNDEELQNLEGAVSTTLQAASNNASSRLQNLIREIEIELARRQLENALKPAIESKVFTVNEIKEIGQAAKTVVRQALNQAELGKIPTTNQMVVAIKTELGTNLKLTKKQMNAIEAAITKIQQEKNL